MINRQQLLKDLQRELPKIEKDILAYSESNPELTQHLQDEYKKAQEAGRTADHFVVWREAQITQAAVAWVLTCVFVRFMEDNGLLVEPVLSGPADREGGDRPLHHAKERMVAYFNDNPTHAEREYLLSLFEELEKFPVIAELLDHKHNPLWQIPVSADGAKLLIDFFQKIDIETGEVVHDFTDDNWDTRFLGDLYQDLSESVRKKYALLQTPEFVESFILDYTLEKAKETFGLKGLRLIDPTCGSGHFLLTTFERCFDDWVRREPTSNTRELAQRSLNVVHGVDVNPYAIAICRFRLLISAMKVCGSKRVKDAPNFQFNLACGDSLLHGKRFEWQGQGIQNNLIDENPIKHVLEVEDKEGLEKILGQQYHVVVGNPPYIIVKDKALNKAYRERYLTCHRKYSLGVPFMERFFELVLTDQNGISGYMGQITTNAFMKREFGTKLVGDYLPNKNITHIIDTSKAFIPGHATPTVILFARNEKPTTSTIKVAMGIKAEPETPDDPSQGKVWSSIIDQIEKDESEDEYVTVVNKERELYRNHPWNLVGGGSVELKEYLDEVKGGSLIDLINTIGFGSILGEEDCFTVPLDKLKASRMPSPNRKLVSGKLIRDWVIEFDSHALFPYDEEVELTEDQQVLDWLWRSKTVLWNRPTFDKTPYRLAGRKYHEYHQIQKDRNRAKQGITFASIASHNHFVYFDKKLAFKQSAPLIHLKEDASKEDYLCLCAYLNSSIACFWMKQVSHQKQMTGGETIRIESIAKVPYDFAGTQVETIPLPPNYELYTQDSSEIVKLIFETISELDKLSADNVFLESLQSEGSCNQNIEKIEDRVEGLKRNLVYLQEEIDWLIYHHFGLIENKNEIVDLSISPVSQSIAPGGRPFELYEGVSQEGFEVTSKWVDSLPDNLKSIWSNRLLTIKNVKNIRLIENPNYKRRWIGRQGKYNHAAKTDGYIEAAKRWILAKVETLAEEKGASLLIVSAIADALSVSDEFLKAISFYSQQENPNVQGVLEKLIFGDSVFEPAATRLKPKGVNKFRAWQEVWGMQVRDDESAPVPPKYASGDFRKSSFWPLRGKLDVPKERFFSMPGCEKDGDTTMVVGWAGMNDLQRAQAIAAWYLDRKESDGWEADKLMPMLVALDELIPWLKQWHNEVDPEFGERMGDYYEGFLLEEMRQLSVTKDDLLAWEPPVATRARRRA